MPSWLVDLLGGVVPTVGIALIAMIYRSGRAVGRIEAKLDADATWRRAHEAEHLAMNYGLKPRSDDNSRYYRERRDSSTSPTPRHAT